MRLTYLDLLSLKQGLEEKAGKETATPVSSGLMSNIDKSNLDSIIAMIPNLATKDEIIELRKPEMIITSTNGWMFKNGEVNTTLNVKIVLGNQEITDDYEDHEFHWSRDSWDKEADRIWNEQTKTGKSIHITRDDIVRGNATTFNCDLIKNNRIILSTRKG